MATRSSTLAWKIPWTEEPGGLQSMGSRRVGHDWATSLFLFTFLHWRRKWQPTPVFLPGESQGWGSLVGCHLWGCTELDTTEQLSSSSSSSYTVSIVALLVCIPTTNVTGLSFLHTLSSVYCLQIFWWQLFWLVAYYNLGWSFFSVLSFCLFILFMGFSR